MHLHKIILTKKFTCCEVPNESLVKNLLIENIVLMNDVYACPYHITIKSYVKCSALMFLLIFNTY